MYFKKIYWMNVAVLILAVPVGFCRLMFPRWWSLSRRCTSHCRNRPWTSPPTCRRCTATRCCPLHWYSVCRRFMCPVWRTNKWRPYKICPSNTPIYQSQVWQQDYYYSYHLGNRAKHEMYMLYHVCMKHIYVNCDLDDINLDRYPDGWLVVFYVPSTARSFRDGTPIYCPLRRTWSSINTPFRPGIEPRAVAWQSITLPLRYASSIYPDDPPFTQDNHCSIQGCILLFIVLSLLLHNPVELAWRNGCVKDCRTTARGMIPGGNGV